jgi:hypothetical protein
MGILYTDKDLLSNKEKYRKIIEYLIILTFYVSLTAEHKWKMFLINWCKIIDEL